MRNRQTRTSFRFQGIHLPLIIIEESRYDARVSIGKTSAYLRIPYTAPSEVKHEKLIWAKKWLLETLTEKPAIAARWKPKEYHTGQEIKTALKTYQLQLSTNNARSTGTVRVDDDQLILSLPKLSEGDYYTREFISSLISKGVASDLIVPLTERVHAYNRLHFRERINGVRLKYIHSRWGSCASTGNLNFSTRILLAPEHIMDHIIIHELSHLKEMNHGPKFWKWVEKGDPDYLRHEAWLKKNGDKLDF